MEVRYDFEFRPTRPDADRALQAASRVREFVEGRFAERWSHARAAFDWKADLRKFRDRQKFEGFFDREITPSTLVEFEQVFRNSLSTGELRRAGEVCFWKNFKRKGNALASGLLAYLAVPGNWEVFVDDLKRLASDPTFENLKAFRSACGEKLGLATPVTFLAFYQPERFPMVDRLVAEWRRQNAKRLGYVEAEHFSQRTPDGGIQGNQQSWKAYLGWAKFCRRTAKPLAELTRQPWRARRGDGSLDRPEEIALPAPVAIPAPRWIERLASNQ